MQSEKSGSEKCSKYSKESEPILIQSQNSYEYLKLAFFFARESERNHETIYVSQCWGALKNSQLSRILKIVRNSMYKPNIKQAVEAIEMFKVELSQENLEQVKQLKVLLKAPSIGPERVQLEEVTEQTVKNIVRVYGLGDTCLRICQNIKPRISLSQSVQSYILSRKSNNLIMPNWSAAMDSKTIYFMKI